MSSHLEGVNVAVAKAALAMGEEALRQHEMKLIPGFSARRQRHAETGGKVLQRLE